jgi:CTP:molybdopterin cytidylyltransferase MocA
MSEPIQSQLRAFGVVVLAAGASQRMGRPKLLLPWGGTTILAHLLATWRALGAAQVAVVTAPGDTPLGAELNRLGFPAPARILNPAPARGMFSSVQCAARWPGWRPGLTYWVVTLGDQPHVSPTTLRALLDLAAGQPEKICQPSRQGRARHPVVLPARVFAQLRDATEAHLKAFLQARAGDRVLQEMEDPALDFDLDEPADYERAVKLAAALPAR